MSPWKISRISVMVVAMMSLCMASIGSSRGQDTPTAHQSTLDPLKNAPGPFLGTVIVARDGSGLVVDVFKIPNKVVTFEPEGKVCIATKVEGIDVIVCMRSSNTKLIYVYGSADETNNKRIWDTWTEYHRGSSWW